MTDPAPSLDAKRVRVAAAQYPLDRFETLGDYKNKLARWVRDAANHGAELLIFPEYGAMEYAGAFGDAARDLAGSLAAVASVSTEMDAHVSALAHQYGVHILGSSGPVRSAVGKITNAARLHAPSGKSGVQHKCMMTPFEKHWGVTGGVRGGVAVGNGLSVFETALGRIGVAICYDSEFPLLVRNLADAGADMILIPSCTEFLSGANRIKTAALARALENGCAVVTSPTVGDAEWSPAVDRNTGRAGVYVPAEHGLSDTGVLAEGELNRPTWIYADIDLAHLRRIRTSGEMRNALDWSQQPGAGALDPLTVVNLT
jgi:predicted amidohydrolase